MVSICLWIAVIFIVLFQAPNLFGIRSYVVTSGSMEPLYPVGSLIYVEQVKPEEIRVGEAITFHMNDQGTVATHQVYEVDVSEKQFRTQGINNRDSEGNILRDALPVSFDSFIGRPILCIPYLGYLNWFCTTKPGCYWVFGAGVVIAGISFVIDNFSKKKTIYQYK